MSEPAVIRAVYADYRRVKGRKVHQVVFELASESWPAAYKVLGEPSIETSEWFAIARLKTEAKPVRSAESVKEKQKFSRLRPSAQAALLCGKPAFWKFLASPECDELYAFDEDSAAKCVRSLCQVESRAELDQDNAKAELWFSLRDRFTAWSTVGE